jgi:hypothetical protein
MSGENKDRKEREGTRKERASKERSKSNEKKETKKGNRQACRLRYR